MPEKTAEAKFIDDLAKALRKARNNFDYDSDTEASPLWEHLGFDDIPNIEHLKALLIKFSIEAISGIDGEILLAAYGLLSGYEHEKNVGDRRRLCLMNSGYFEYENSNAWNEYLKSESEADRDEILKDAVERLRKKEDRIIRNLAVAISGVRDLPKYTEEISKYLIKGSDQKQKTVRAILPEPSPTMKVHSLVGPPAITGVEPQSEAPQSRAQTDIFQLSQEKLAALEELTINVRSAEDIEAIAGYTNLKRLTLFAEEVRDFSPLAKLTRLENLLIHTIGLHDLTPIAALTGLKRLEIKAPCDSDGKTTGENRIHDIRALGSLSNLRELVIWCGRVQDISPLMGLRKLEKLLLPYNEIQAIPDLSGLTNLRELSLAYNQIENADNVSRLLGLRKLFLSYNQIKIAPDVQRLTLLEVLNLSGNQIEKLPDLSRLTRLQMLSAAYNRLKTVPDLSNFKELQELYLGYNQIESIPDLSSLTKLRILNLSGNKIENTPTLK